MPSKHFSEIMSACCVTPEPSRYAPAPVTSASVIASWAANLYAVRKQLRNGLAVRLRGAWEQSGDVSGKTVDDSLLAQP
jgi:hypothetical protein